VAKEENVPKLSKQTLEKRFQCPKCGKSIRSRQGLSGHIQFKHSAGAVKEEPDIVDEAFKIKHHEMFLKSIGYNEKEITELTQVRKDWVRAKVLIEDTKLSKADYKAFQITAYAVIFSEMRLKTWLTHELGEAISKLMDLSTKIPKQGG